MSYKEILDNIANNPSRNYKQHILEVNQADETLKKIFEMALHPLKNYYIKKNIPKYKQGEIVYTIQGALEMLSGLLDRTYTGKAAIEYLTMILSGLSPDDADVILRVVKKKLNCGVAVETVNAVWPGLVFKYPCMLCEPYEEKFFKKITGPFYVQTKEDGGRFNAVVRNGTCQFFTRNGNNFLLDSKCEEYFINLSGGENIVFDGELLVEGKVRQEGNGKLTKAIRGTITQEEIDNIYFTLWDCIPYRNFYHGKCSVPYETRLGTLEELIMNLNNPKIKLVETTECSSFNEVLVIYQEKLSQDLEGVVIKSKNGPWENKRVQYQLKMKAELDCDLLCIGTLNGLEGKYENCIGSLVCQSADGLLKVNIGSGLKDADRQREDFPGSIIWVKYNNKILGDDGFSLFLPIYKGVRVDKDTADKLEDIK